MIERLSIQNFRCFRQTELKDLARINILVGKNGSGKTAFLESIFIGNGNPDLILRVRSQRLGEGVAAIMSGDSDSLLPIIRPLFHNFDTKRSIEIKAFGVGINTVARIFEQESSLKYDFFPRGNVGKSKTYTIRFSGGEFKTTPTPIIDHKLAFYASSIKHSPVEASRKFSEISRRDATEKFVSALSSSLPGLEDLSIEIENGIPMVFAKMKGVEERLPMQFVSDGITRLLSILIGISTTAKGTVLIDELENGIYHQSFPAVIRAIRDFADIYDVQLFITTHSKELLQAFAAAPDGSEENFSLIRFDSGDTEQFGGNSFRNAIAQDIEIR